METEVFGLARGLLAAFLSLGRSFKVLKLVDAVSSGVVQEQKTPKVTRRALDKDSFVFEISPEHQRTGRTDPNDR